MRAKFLSTFVEKSAEELTRRQHYADSQEYMAYHAGLQDDPDFWCEQSRELQDWRQLEDLGLISRGTGHERAGRDPAGRGDAVP